MKRTVFPNRWLPYLLVLPQVAVTIVFFFWPAVNSLYLAPLQVAAVRRARHLRRPRQLHGAADRPRVLRERGELVRVRRRRDRRSAWWRGWWWRRWPIRRSAGWRFYRTALLWPYGIAPAVAGIIFLFIFHPSYGVLPYFLSFVTAYEFNWLLKGWVAMALVIGATAWTHVGYNIAFFLAGLQAIPTSVMEAASVDGASPIRKFTAIIVPLISPVTFYLVVVNMVSVVLRLLRRHPRRHPRRPRQRHRDHGLQAVEGRVHRPQPRLLGRSVGAADGGRDRDDDAAVPRSPRRRSRTDGPGASHDRRRRYPRAPPGGDGRARRRAATAAVPVGDPGGARVADRVRRCHRVPALLRVRHLDPGSQRGRPEAAAPAALHAHARELRGGLAPLAHGPAARELHDRGGGGGGGQDRHLDAVGVRDRLLPLPRQLAGVLDDLHHADAADPRADPADLRGDRQPRLAEHATRGSRCRSWRRRPPRSCSASSI